jgi:hypothetical protein
MKLMTLIFASLLIPGVAAHAAAAKPEVFRIKIQPKLAKLTANLQHPGTVNIEYAPEGKEIVAEIVLDSYCAVYNGDEHCHGSWSQVLKMEEAEFSYFVNIANSAHSDAHTAVLTLCLTGEPKSENCGKWISSQINFNGAAAPRLQTYDSSHWNNSPSSPASFQPVLTIGPAN